MTLTPQEHLKNATLYHPLETPYIPRDGRGKPLTDLCDALVAGYADHENHTRLDRDDMLRRASGIVGRSYNAYLDALLANAANLRQARDDFTQIVEAAHIVPHGEAAKFVADFEANALTVWDTQVVTNGAQDSASRAVRFKSGLVLQERV